MDERAKYVTLCIKPVMSIRLHISRNAGTCAVSFIKLRAESLKTNSELKTLAVSFFFFHFITHVRNPAKRPLQIILSACLYMRPTACNMART